jgi:CDP-diacylglycerol--glycerol-3-phosphate 3-phosphatidyltransferase
VPVLADQALRGLRGLVAGGNKHDVHLTGVEPDRDFDPEWVDVRRVEAGDRDPAGSPIRIEPAIEVGNIFKLGMRYSEPLGASYLDEEGKEQLIWMGSYGIGPARTVAAAIEQFADEQGISWPRAVAPFDVELVTLGKPGEEARSLSDQLYDQLRELGLDVLYDDRDDASAGQKFADAELLGCPLRVTIGKKSVEAREIEFQARPGKGIPTARGRRRGGGGAVADPPLTFRRLVGLDRSGGAPPQTRRGEPLNPWTIPNAIGFARLALVPLFLVIGLSSGDGRSGLAFALFAFIAWSDYFDGMAARITGQYSRLGALLDPLTDRVLVLSGAVVAWHYETLPRSALLVLAVREALMLVFTQIALRRGLDLNVSMLGRWAVWPVMSALALALVIDSWVLDVILWVAVAMTLAATVRYVQDGVRALGKASTST